MTMHLVQLLLPLRDNEGTPFPRQELDRVRAELTEAFGGVTAYLQSPAEGLWKEDDGRVDRDRVVIFEAMTASLDRAWWGRYRADLEGRFRQDEVVVRALGMEKL